MAPRNQEDVLRGVLSVSIDGKPRDLPVRRIAAARKWKSSLARAIGGDVASMNLASLEDGGSVALAIGDRLLDLVVEYDETAALGGRSFLEENATDAEVYAIFRALIEVSFPFVRDLRTIVAELRAIGLADLIASARSLTPSSTNGASANGGSVLVASTPS